MTEIETWAPVPGWEVAYEVSDLARVRSLDRISSGKRRLGRVLKPTLNRGYYWVHLKHDGWNRNRPVHRLVMEAFAGPPPAGMEVCHNDGDSTNSRLSNLRWDTHRANLSDRYAHGTIGVQCRRGHPFDEENTLVRTDGERVCRACARTRNREGKARRRAAARGELT